MNNQNIANEISKMNRRKKGVKNKHNISIISVRLLDLLKKNLNTIVTYKKIKTELNDILSDDLSNNDKLKYINRAFKVLKNANFNVEKTNQPKGYKFIDYTDEILDNIYIKDESLLLFLSAKSELFKNYYDNDLYKKYIRTSRFCRCFDNSRYFVYTNEAITISADNIISLELIIKAIKKNKYISFSTNGNYILDNKNIYYKPIGILVDNYILYLATIFQLTLGGQYTLDFIPIRSIANVQIEDYKNNYNISIKKIYEKCFYNYKEDNPSLFDKDNLEVLVDIFKNHDYGYNHSCLLRLYNKKYVEELDIKFIVYTEVSENTNRGIIYYSTVYYENEDDFFDWIYHKYKLKDLAKKNKQLKRYDYSYNVEFTNYKIRKRYDEYEIKRDLEK